MLKWLYNLNKYIMNNRTYTSAFATLSLALVFSFAFIAPITAHADDEGFDFGGPSDMGGYDFGGSSDLGGYDFGGPANDDGYDFGGCDSGCGGGYDFGG